MITPVVRAFVVGQCAFSASSVLVSQPQAVNLAKKPGRELMNKKKAPPVYPTHLLEASAVRGESFDNFVTDVTDALRARPLQPEALKGSCVGYFEETLAPKADNTSMWLMFGALSGENVRRLGKACKKLSCGHKIYVFDSFAGEPDDWDSDDPQGKTVAKRGEHSFEGKLPKVRSGLAPYVEFVPGFYNSSITPFMTKTPGPASFVNIDSLHYRSAATILDGVAPRLRPGSVVIFNDLINFPEFRDGEMKALWDFVRGPAFAKAGLKSLEVVGYKGGHLLTDPKKLKDAAKSLEWRYHKYPQDAMFRVW